MPGGGIPMTTTYPQLPPRAESQWRHRVAHTQLFELGEGHHRQAELQVDKVDWTGEV